MRQYPKQILSIRQQIQTYIDAGMLIQSVDDVWNEFVERLKELITQNIECIQLTAMNFPEDWEMHLRV